MPQITDQVKYPDAIHTDNGRVVRIASANPNLKIRVHGRNIRVGDIPLTAAKLGCEHIIRGIAFEVNDLFYCDEHGVEPFQTFVKELL